jgi:hypothetical protein
LLRSADCAASFQQALPANHYFSDDLGSLSIAAHAFTEAKLFQYLHDAPIVHLVVLVALLPAARKPLRYGPQPLSKNAQKIFGLESKSVQELELKIDAGHCRAPYTNHPCEEGAKEAVAGRSARDLFPNSRIVVNFSLHRPRRFKTSFRIAHGLLMLSNAPDSLSFDSTSANLIPSSLAARRSRSGSYLVLWLGFRDHGHELQATAQLSLIAHADT